VILVSVLSAVGTPARLNDGVVSELVITKAVEAVGNLDVKTSDLAAAETQVFEFTALAAIVPTPPVNMLVLAPRKSTVMLLSVALSSSIMFAPVGTVQLKVIPGDAGTV